MSRRVHRRTEPKTSPRRLTAFCALLAGCSAPAIVTAPPRPAAQEEATPPFLSPARWAYFPREPGQPTASLEISDHRCIVLTDSGDRWLVRGNASSPCKGVATASSSPVYEALVGVREADHEYDFIAQSGTVYVATEPLGAFVRYTKAPQPLHQVAASKSAIVGVDEAGNAYYFASEGGAGQSGSWKRASQPASSRLFTLGVDDHDRVLAVGVPETVYTSTDGGKTYGLATAAGSPRPARIGALSVTRSKKGELAIEGVMGSLVWEDGGHFARSTESLTASGALGASIEPSPSPTTGAIREGRAQVTGDRYYDLRYPDGGAAKDESDGSPYVLARGPLVGPLEIKPLRSSNSGAFADCTEMRLAAHGRGVVIACSHALESGSDMGVSLLASVDGGDRFDPVADLVTPSFSDIAMAVGPEGSLMITNVCRVGEERRRHKDEHAAVEGCHPRGPLFGKVEAAKAKPAAPSAAKSPAGTKPPKKSAAREKPEAAPDGRLRATFVQGNAVQLQGNAFAPAIGPEGKLYFLGRRKKDDRPAIYVSTDGGRSYEARALEAPSQSAAPSDDPNGETAETYYGNLDFSGDGTRLTVDDSGTLGLACDSSGGFAWVTADSDGRVATVSGAPEQGASLGGWGRRVVSIGYGATDGVIRAWESSDGGQSFNEISTTAAVGNYFNGDTLIACEAGGCLLGDTLARIGWEGQTETPLNMAEDFPPPLDAKLRPTLACELTAKTTWTPVRNLSAGPSIYPRLTDMMRGNSAWAVMTREPESGEIDVTSASIPDKTQDPSQVQTHAILSGNTGAKGRLVTLAKPQAEGFVAAKAIVPEVKGRFDVGKPIDGLEIGWVNFYTGTFGKRTVRDAGIWTPALASGNALTPALLTVTGPGVVFRAGLAPKSLFVDNGGKTTVFDYPDWASLGLSGPVTSDAALVDGQIFAVGFVDRSPTANIFAIAHKPRGASGYVAEAVTYAQGNSDWDWVYLGAQNGVSALSTNLDQDASEAWAFIVQPDGSLGERMALPTLRDLGDRPRACTAEDRKTTPRTVAPAFSHRGTLLYRSGRQPIQVTEGGQSSKSLVATEPVWFLSDGAVLYGTPKDPCVAGVRGSATKRGSVVVVSGDLEHAWMFRPSALASMGAPSTCNCPPDDPLCACPDDEVTVDPKKKPPARRTRVSSVEFRPMTCKVKPDLAPPYEVTSQALIRSVEDIP